jgi:chemotaxis family two-component system sensor kinase Cph1
MKEAGAQITRGELPRVLADRSQMAQLLQNFISNALKFRTSEAPRIEVSAERMPEEWTISVCDNGIGIDPKYAEQIFLVFKRLHTHAEYPLGTGIGLAICAKIVARHGGRIWVESQVGQGATFRFTLPVAGHAPD